MTENAQYTPPLVWEWNAPNGGQFANINRPVAGATHEKELPVGRHPLQLYSLGTPNSSSCLPQDSAVQTTMRG
jgi:GST-like protein